MWAGVVQAAFLAWVARSIARKMSDSFMIGGFQRLM
jgi:hypothetical protein